MDERISKYIREEVFPTPFCAGCGHGILLGAIVRAIDRGGFDIDRMVFVSGIGCAAWIPSPHIAADTLHVTHGRPVAFATGVKLSKPELITVVVSGDGDLASIGGNHLIHAARRDVDITVICANNFIYGMTGGQVSSLTPLDSETSTTPGGNPERPFDLCRLVKAAGARYVARYTVLQIRHLIKAIVKAINSDGFSFVEVISPCPTQFGRRNRMPQIIDIFSEMKERTISIKESKELDDDKRANLIITGEFI
jgi:2-oxoglutarate ferredoxin oxidoreductase subunit beta